MARATVRTLKPRDSQTDRGAHDHPVTAKIASDDFAVMTALSLIDQTGPADQIRAALDHYFTFRMKDSQALSQGIDRARRRQEAALSVLTGKNVIPVEDPEAVPVAERSAPLDRPVTLRVNAVTFDLLTAFSLVDEVSLADVLRSAIASYISYRKDDPQLLHKLDAAKAKYDNTMSVLASGTGTG